MFEFNFVFVKILFVEVGYKNGFDMNIWVMLVSCIYNFNVCKMVELM